MTEFENQNTIEVFRQALLISGFDAVRDTFLAALSSSSAFTNEQKLAIRLAGAKLFYMGPSPAGVESLLLQILNLTWQDVGLGGDDVVALSIEQRVGIIDGIMLVCKAIIAAESSRLQALAESNTALAYGYGYGSNGYGEGFDGVDFFDVLGWGE